MRKFFTWLAYTLLYITIGSGVIAGVFGVILGSIWLGFRITGSESGAILGLLVLPGIALAGAFAYDKVK